MDGGSLTAACAGASLAAGGGAHTGSESGQESGSGSLPPTAMDALFVGELLTAWLDASSAIAGFTHALLLDELSSYTPIETSFLSPFVDISPFL